MGSIDSYVKRWWESYPLIVINVAVFLAAACAGIVCMIAGIGVNPVVWCLELPPTLKGVALHPWGVVTYMFTHYDFIHLLFNMLWLYWFAMLLQTLCTYRQVVGLYILGGLGGAALYLLAGACNPMLAGGGLVGASASVIAIVVSVAVLTPNLEVPLMLLGPVKVKWIALVAVAFFVLGVSGANAPGQVAHIGGAVMGVAFALGLRSGHDITKPFNSIIDSAVNMMRRPSLPKLNFKRKHSHRATVQPDTDNTEGLDRILDKVKLSGYGALTADEKSRLFSISSNLRQREQAPDPMEQPPQRRRAKGKGWTKSLWWVAVTLLALATVASAYGGVVNPDVSTIPAILEMLFPALALLMVVAAVVSLWIDRRSILVCVATLIGCAGPLWTYSPLNLFRPDITPQEKAARGFTLMSYNVYNFREFNPDNYPKEEYNRTLNYILKEDPDIVCLVECEYLCPMKQWHMYQQQCDSAYARYPYEQIDDHGNSLLSKFPFRQLSLDIPAGFGGRISAYRMDIRNEQFTLFVVHMPSIGLTADDKELFKALTRLNAAGEYHQVKNRLLGKLSVAFRYRARQARVLRDCIDRLSDGGNVIVTGDFNDIPGSYALRTVMGSDLKSAYTECGIGPTITYYGNRFYFRIDHTLYRGAFDAVGVKRGNIRSSDHYPLITEFLLAPAD